MSAEHYSDYNDGLSGFIDNLRRKGAFETRLSDRSGSKLLDLAGRIGKEIGFDDFLISEEEEKAAIESAWKQVYLLGLACLGDEEAREEYNELARDEGAENLKELWEDFRKMSKEEKNSQLLPGFYKGQLILLVSYEAGEGGFWFLGARHFYPFFIKGRKDQVRALEISEADDKFKREIIYLDEADRVVFPPVYESDRIDWKNRLVYTPLGRYFGELAEIEVDKDEDHYFVDKRVWGEAGDEVNEVKRVVDVSLEEDKRSHRFKFFINGIYPGRVIWKKRLADKGEERGKKGRKILTDEQTIFQSVDVNIPAERLLQYCRGDLSPEWSMVMSVSSDFREGRGNVLVDLGEFPERFVTGTWERCEPFDLGGKTVTEVVYLGVGAGGHEYIFFDDNYDLIEPRLPVTRRNLLGRDKLN